jgi:hypothetical protein
MKEIEKDTITGIDYRDYECSNCGHTEWKNNGPALWRVISDAREEEETHRRASQSAPSQFSSPKGEKALDPVARKGFWSWLDRMRKKRNAP